MYCSLSLLNIEANWKNFVFIKVIGLFLFQTTNDQTRFNYVLVVNCVSVHSHFGLIAFHIMTCIFYLE